MSAALELSWRLYCARLAEYQALPCVEAAVAVKEAREKFFMLKKKEKPNALD